MPVDDYSKCLHELSKWEVRYHAGAKRPKSWGIFLKGTSIRGATFLVGASGLQRALKHFFDEQAQRKAKREKKRKHDQASPDSA